MRTFLPLSWLSACAVLFLLPATASTSADLREQLPKVVQRDTNHFLEGLIILDSGMETWTLESWLAELSAYDYGHELGDYFHAILNVSALLDAKAKGQWKTAIIVKPRK